MESAKPTERASWASSVALTEGAITSASTQAKLEAALKEIPTEQQAAYQQALVQAPTLVATETPFERFLVTKDHNAVAAAKCLCRYWQERCHLFQERAFLPMNLTGSGALDAQDIEFFNTACFVILPPETDTRNEHRTIMALDVARFAEKFPPMQDVFYVPKLRVTFYNFQVASENKFSQTLGTALLAIQLGPEDKDKKVDSGFVSLVQNALPIRRMEVHFIFLPSRLKEKQPKGLLLSTDSIIDDLLSFKLSMLSFFSRMSFTHRGRTDEEVLEKVVNCGFKRQCLPTWYGGSWSLDDFQRWKERRLLIEQDKQDQIFASSSKKEQKIARRRVVQSNAIRSKKKRERRKQELETLKEQKKRLLNENATLQQNIQNYEQLLGYVENEIAALSDISQPVVSDPFMPEFSSIPSDEQSTHRNEQLEANILASPQHLAIEEDALCSPHLELEWGDLEDIFKESAGNTLSS